LSKTMRRSSHYHETIRKRRHWPAPFNAA